MVPIYALYDGELDPIDALREKLKAGSRGSPYAFKEDGAFQAGVKALATWLEERFPMRSELMDLVAYDS
jgi:hypothetical protein